MKSAKLILLVVLLLLAAAGGVLHGLLKRALIDVTDTAVLDLGGPDTRVGRTEVAAFRGRVVLRNVALTDVRDAPDIDRIDVDEVRAHIAPLASLTGRIDVRRLELTGMHVTVTRGTPRRAASGAHVPAVRPGAPDVCLAAVFPYPALAAAAGNGGERDVLIRELSVRAVIDYTDHDVADQPAHLALDLLLEGHDIATYAPSESEWGRFAVTGHHADDPEAFLVNIEGVVGPLADTGRPDFSLNGSIRKIDVERLGPAAAEIDIRGAETTLKVTLKCRDGRFDKTASSLTVEMDRPQLFGKLARKAGGLPLPPSLTVTAPLGGTVEQPEFDLEGALVQSVVRNLGNLFGAVGKKPIQIDTRKAEEELSKALDDLSDFLKDL